ncbi:hypothetical protein [Pseudonocardia sp. GCM10023141]|uniref:hypothetical protein n=1 Tax=Pseudonocardia sp. GCM10023141 TaxID=3252653 RepID=UPI0036078B23
MRRRLPALLAAIPALVAGLAFAPVASAQEAAGGSDVALLVDRVAPEMPGVTLTADATAPGPRLVLRNPTATEVTVLSSAGDPMLRVGPGGAFGNLRSPEWFTAKTADGSGPVPETTAEHAKPIWLQVSADPAWSWFDQRLRAAVPTPLQRAAAKPLDRFGSWTVPLAYGDVTGSAAGHSEFRPASGTFTPEVSNARPAPDVTVAVAAGSSVPDVTVQNSGRSDVVVLGAAGEPYLRLSPQGSAANTASPTWRAAQDPAVPDPAAPDPAAPDPAAVPQWTPVSTEARATFPLPGATLTPEPAALYAMTEPAVVSTWRLSLLVDGRPTTVDGSTTLTPAGYVEPWWHRWVVPAIVAASVVIVVEIIVLAVVIRRRRPARTRAVSEREIVDISS